MEKDKLFFLEQLILLTTRITSCLRNPRCSLMGCPLSSRYQFLDPPVHWSRLPNGSASGTCAPAAVKPAFPLSFEVGTSSTFLRIPVTHPVRQRWKAVPTENPGSHSDCGFPMTRVDCCVRMSSVFLKCWSEYVLSVLTKKDKLKLHEIIKVGLKIYNQEIIYFIFKIRSF